MKTIILTGRQISLLLKVSNSGCVFYFPVEEFLENNKRLSEDESIELILEDSDYFNDITDMIQLYLQDDSLSDQDYPSEKERIELGELIVELNEI